MTPKEALLRHLRAEIVTHVDFIKQHPAKFKVCEGCDRAVAADADICQACHAYRFDYDAARVLERASFRHDAVEHYYATLPRF